MYMKMLERILLRFLINNKIKMAIVGFDTKGFAETLNQELKERLETVESILFTDDDLMSDEEKIWELKELFQSDFYIKE
ncbi:MAG: hypothetical protein HFF52_08680 [Lawsonibacter sp.]|nr:hypothetical protein [Lawsonibacter sp.]